MNSLADAVSAYQAAGQWPSGEWPGKIEAVLEIEKRILEAGALDFLLAILADNSEYDLARVEICKVLRADMAGAAEAAADRCARALLSALTDPSEELVRQWAAIALLRFAAEKGVALALAQRVLDEDEDTNVRINAADTLGAAGLPEPSRALLESGPKDGEVGATVQDVLARHNARRPGRAG